MRALMVLTVAVLCATCNLYQPVEVVDPDCLATTEVVVGPGLQPSVSWVPACRVAWVTVRSLPLPATGSQAPTWQRKAFNVGIVPPMRVGPRVGVSQPTDVSLVPGMEYLICLSDVVPVPRQRVLEKCARFSR